MADDPSPRGASSPPAAAAPPPERVLWRLAQTGDAAGVRAALASGGAAAIDADDGTEGVTALCHACAQGHEEVVRTLLRHGADASIVDRSGKKAVDLASSPSILEVFKRPPSPIPTATATVAATTTASATAGENFCGSWITRSSSDFHFPVFTFLGFF